MEVQKSQAKLTRTQSSLVRSPPTIRSSIHSLSFVRDEEAAEEEGKPHKSISGISDRFMNRSNRLVPVMGTVLLSFSFFFFFYFYLRREEIPSSENLLLALVFIAIALYVGGKNKGFVIQTALFLRQFWDVKNKKLEISRRRHESVEWFIGNGGSSSFKKEKTVKGGVEFYSNGDFYEGEFHNGMCNGSGVYYYVLNGRYEGDWSNGRYDGYGVENWARGSKYRGQYRQGLRHGYGVYRFYTGDSYAGEWFNGQSHGIGVQTCSDGSCYVGEFKCGVKHGLGCYHFRNGDIYGGEYFGDKIHGFGVYHFANGHCYEGSWHEGQKHGFGMYTFRNGDARCGELDAGVLKTTLPPLTDAVLRAVQSARKATENASRLPPVDDLVKKAVITASRAATAARVAAIKAVQNRMDGKFCDLDI